MPLLGAMNIILVQAPCIYGRSFILKLFIWSEMNVKGFND